MDRGMVWKKLQTNYKGKNKKGKAIPVTGSEGP
jgi:hypothetical protein